MSTTKNKSLLSNAGEFLRNYQFLIVLLMLFGFLFYLTDDITDKIVDVEKVEQQNTLLLKVVTDQRDLINLQKKYSVDQKHVIELQRIIIKRYNKILEDLKEFMDPPEPIDPRNIT